MNRSMPQKFFQLQNLQRAFVISSLTVDSMSNFEQKPDTGSGSPCSQYVEYPPGNHEEETVDAHFRAKKGEATGSKIAADTVTADRRNLLQLTLGTVECKTERNQERNPGVYLNRTGPSQQR